jgi:hypothetical protein
MALNPSISTAGYDRVHRVVGVVSGNAFAGTFHGVQTNNLAREGMVITVGGVPVSPTDTGNDGLDGQDTTRKPVKVVYKALGWDFDAVWKMGADGYPVLCWQE